MWVVGVGVSKSLLGGGNEEILSFSKKKVLWIAKKTVSLPHALAGSKVRMICRRVEPGA
jgi:hypothetical protein